jgi:fluoroquinolone resistance protein
MQYESQEFTNKIFEGVDFSKLSFRYAVFVDCTFSNCNLSNVDVTYTRFQTVHFTNCKIMGVDFSKCHKLIMDMDFKVCQLSMCIFSDLDLQSTVFESCKIIECDFFKTNLSNTNFQDSDLGGTRFDDTNLTNASFRSAKNYSINPNTNFLKKTKFARAEASGLLDSFDIDLD